MLLLYIVIQIIAEFELILGVKTSILDTFRSNFTQVAEQLIEMAKMKDRKKKSGMQEHLKFLKEDSNDYNDDDADNTPGKRTIMWIKVKHVC